MPIRSRSNSVPFGENFFSKKLFKIVQILKFLKWFVVANKFSRKLALFLHFGANLSINLIVDKVESINLKILNILNLNPMADAMVHEVWTINS